MFKITIRDNPKFKIRVPNTPKFFIKLKNGLSGWALKEKTSFSVKGNIGNGDLKGVDLPEFAKDLPVFAKEVCGIYFYVKAWIKNANANIRVATSPMPTKLQMMMKGGTNFCITSTCRAIIWCAMVGNVSSYKMQSQSVAAIIAWKTYCDNENFSVVTGCRERLNVIAKGTSRYGVDTSTVKMVTRAITKGGAVSKVRTSTLPSRLYTCLYARNNREYAKDNPVMAIDSCYTVVN